MIKNIFKSLPTVVVGLFLCLPFISNAQKKDFGVASSCELVAAIGGSDVTTFDSAVNSISIVNCTDGEVVVDFITKAGKPGNICIPACNSLNLTAGNQTILDVTTTYSGAGTVTVNGIRDGLESEPSVEIQAASCPDCNSEIEIEGIDDILACLEILKEPIPDTSYITKDICENDFIVCYTYSIIAGEETETNSTPTGISCAIPDAIDTEINVICNEETDVWNLVSVTTINGVEGVPIITPLEVPCDLPQPQYIVKRECVDGIQFDNTYIVVEDIETLTVSTDTGISCSLEDFDFIRECRGGFINIVCYSLNQGIKTEIDASVTEEACTPPVDIEYITRDICIDGLITTFTYSVIDAVFTEVESTPTLIECESEDIEYVVKRECVDNIQFDNTYSIIEGVELLVSSFETGISCSLEEFDFIRECRDGLINIVCYSLNEGTKIEVGTTITEETCTPFVDYETERECRDDFINIIQYEDGVEVSATVTDEVCEEYILKFICEIDEGATNGIVGQRWDNSDGDDTNGVGATDFLPNSEVFINGVHVNGTPNEEVTITNNWSLNDNDFTSVVLPDIHSQERYYAYLNITEPMLLRDNNGNWGEYLNVFIQDCNKDMVEVANTYTTPGYPNNSAGVFYEVCEGIRKIEVQVNDFSWYGGFNLQQSVDGGNTWTAFPITETYTYSPKINEVCIKVDSEGNEFNLDGTPYTGKKVKCDPACYPMSREGLPDTEVSIINACFDVDGDPSNYIPVTQEIIFTGGEQTSATYYQNYGADTQTEVQLGEYTFVDCATGEPIDEPIVPVLCEQAYPVTAFAPIGDNGVNFEYWDEIENIDPYTAQDQAADVFNGAVDYSGMPAINSAEGLPETRKEADLFIRDPDITQNAYRYWTYLYTTEAIRLREFHPTAESAVYYIGECQTTPVLTATGEYFNNTLPPALDISLPAGIHYIGGEVYDFSAWGFTRFQYSDDNGATWKNVPPSWLYCSEPTLSECQVQVCLKENGDKVLTDIQTCLPLGSEYTLKKPSLCSGSVAVQQPLQCASQTFYRTILGEVGTVEQKWTGENVGPASTATGSSYLEAFSLTDSEGYPAHTNAPDATTVSSTITSTTNVGGTILDDQAQSDFWIYLDEDTQLRESNATAEAAGVWISTSCGSYVMEEVVDAVYTNTGSTTFGVYPAGYYKVRLYHSDATANGVSRLQGLTNGTWSNLTPYLTAPTFEVIKGWYCDDGNNYNQDKSEVLGEEWKCENPKCTPSGTCKINITN